MSVRPTGKKIDVYQSNRFEKALKKLPGHQLAAIEDQVDYIIDNPEIGEPKKGDLAHIRVHKFKLDSQLWLLGYSWIEDRLELFLLQAGSHENFYAEHKRQRAADLKLIK